MFHDSRRAGSLGEPAPVVLMIMGLFDGEYIFIHVQNSLPVQRCDETKELPTYFQSYTLIVVSCQKLNTMELVYFELLFGYSAARFARYIVFMGILYETDITVSWTMSNFVGHVF